MKVETTPTSGSCTGAYVGVCCHDRLLRAATEAFLEEGYRASVDRIAARAGVAKQTLYNHFGTKEDLYRAVGRTLADAMAEELGQYAEESDLSQTLTRLALHLREKFIGDRGLGIYRSFHVESARAPEVTQAIHERVMNRLIGLISDIVRSAMDQGRLRRDDPQLAAEMLLSMLVHVDRGYRLAGTPRLPPQEEEQRVRSVVDFFLRAFAPSSVSPSALQSQPTNAKSAQEQK